MTHPHTTHHDHCACRTGIAAHTAPLIDPDCRDRKHAACAGGPCQCQCHAPTDGLRAQAPPAAR